jgi:hypothetical protein
MATPTDVEEPNAMENQEVNVAGKWPVGFIWPKASSRPWPTTMSEENSQRTTDGDHMQGNVVAPDAGFGELQRVGQQHEDSSKFSVDEGQQQDSGTIDMSWALQDKDGGRFS